MTTTKDTAIQAFRITWLLIIGLLTLISPRTALTYDFVPTEADWSSWPRYCQVRYAGTNVGGQSDFADRVSATEAAGWRAQIGNDTYLHLHHYCAGVALFNQSRSVADSARKQYLLNLARGEALYTHSRLPASCLLCGDIASTLARIELALGNQAEAIDVLKRQIFANPTDTRSYVTLAVMLRDLKRTDEGIEVLKKCDVVMEGMSAEVHYNLGLLYLDAGNIDLALDSAHKAYALNHPLPGLRNRLQAMGRWTSAPPASSGSAPVASSGP